MVVRSHASVKHDEPSAIGTETPPGLIPGTTFMPRTPRWVEQLANGEAVVPPPEYRHAMEVAGRGYRETYDPYDWVETRRLYKTYLDSFQNSTAGEGHQIRQLNPFQFGLVMRCLFPGAAPCRRHRTSDCRVVRGWAGVTGPEAERTPAESDTFRRQRRRRRVKIKQRGS